MKIAKKRKPTSYQQFKWKLRRELYGLLMSSAPVTYENALEASKKFWAKYARNNPPRT